MLIDTHAHLYWESYEEDLSQVLQSAKNAGITTIINIGVDIESSKKSLQQAQTIKKITVYTSIGIHPHEATNYGSTPGVDAQNAIELDVKELENIYHQNSDLVIQIGECGLDYVLDPSYIPSGLTKEQVILLQKKLMLAQIDLAKKLKLPLSIHCRDDRSQTPPLSAWSEIFDYLKGTTGILHCYSGLPEHTQIALKTDYLISFAANITYPKNGYLREAAKIIPLDRIVLETDCPFLSPQSKRGQRNEPANVLEIASCIAEIKGIPFEEVARQTTDNVRKLLKLSSRTCRQARPDVGSIK